jgi:hypothetical protein
MAYAGRNLWLLPRVPNYQAPSVACTYAHDLDSSNLQLQGRYAIRVAFLTNPTNSLVIYNHSFLKDGACYHGPGARTKGWLLLELPTMMYQSKSDPNSPDPYQVRRSQRQQDHFSLPRAYAEMVRDGEQSGWGRRVEGTVRLVKPASRFNVIEPEHKLLKPIHSSHIRDERPQRTEAEPADLSPAAGGANALLPNSARPHDEGNKRPVLERSTLQRPGANYIGLSSTVEVALLPMPPANEVMTSPSTPSELRQEARQMFERYGLSPPIS